MHEGSGHAQVELSQEMEAYLNTPKVWNVRIVDELGNQMREYNSWSQMLRRCLNSEDKSYPSYGGRGIKVCERWLDFDNFLDDMGNKPSLLHSIDRIKNDGNYEPSNCRWATVREQARNRRTSRMLELNGVSKCVAEWSEITGISSPAIFARIHGMGWPVEKALTTPISTRHQYFGPRKRHENKT